MSLAIGETFAGYKILRLLGSGGMGEVYLVQHPRLPRQEALKILRPDLSIDASFRERFIREADLSSGLRHANIVGVHDRGDYEGQLWIAMDYIDGNDAGHLLNQKYPGGMPVDLALPIITAVASALDYAHKQGLLHRDVKPANIIIANPDGEEASVFIADFGIARPLEDISGITTTNMTVGTVAYSAPEQLMGEPMDGRADQYALAATTYHLLTGSQLFPNSNPAVVISRHLNSPAPALADLRPELASLDPVLAIGLGKNRDDRFATCADFARTLVEQSRHGAPAPAAPTAQALVQRPAHGKPRRALTAPVVPIVRRGVVRRWLLPLGALVLVATIGVIVWHPWDSRRDESTTDSGAGSATTAPADNPTSSAVTPGRPTMPASAVATVLLTAPEISNVLSGIEVSGDPGNTYSAILKLDGSSYGPSDHAREVDPPTCASVVFTGDQSAYGNTKVEAMKTESFSPGPNAVGNEGPWQLQQTTAVFPSAESANSFLVDQQRQWATCSTPANPPSPNFPDIDVSVVFGYENGRSFILGNVERIEDMIVISMASNDPLWGAHACQQVLGVRDNVVAEARTCQVPPNATSIGGLEPADPDWALPDAQHLVAAMLDKIT
ncbi:serine/threonine-protein kinase PknH/PknJ [Mycolicibacterium holsaticum]|uniref:serine/threonine-protein kinase PknH/PknJ n=1 Tax=Mycolicibacterium holsaticum TaxID=152142 RepID=UPI001C7D9A40|nr:serine/threonine-protein kinase PknH/PknJ [Mycolicibacterium holsaticum]MDA4109729.1 serine/threonine protein kinase [Mycolicibacterium holsaticum DSM 44478 = JCM 12374]QZA10653.1 protein kinase [Mycolicibacterium holsaticum DSM 44478 = JCM 12374]UNC11842.1 sensor domain-containing protein [Mycolicibacterium holsaticum DSM 44478 = JCM 12374]